MELKFDIYTPGENAPRAADALKDALAFLDVGASYSDMMRLRASGGAAEECRDVYYLCTNEQNRLISRLWMGWGKHAGAVGNWGNFFTDEAFRGRGIGTKMLELWYADMISRTDVPVAFFCTTGAEKTARMYAPYGFRCAIKGATFGPMYCPLGNSPETFEEFCEQYYKPANALEFRPASIGWRHEIDCLYKFAMLALGSDYLPRGVESLERAILDNDKSVELIFTDKNIPVGVCRTGKDGKKDITVYPSYVHLL